MKIFQESLTLSVTPQLTPHARQRASDMGVGTKRIKRLCRLVDTRRPAGTREIWTSQCEPTLAVVVEERGHDIIVITVVPRTKEVYVR